MTLIHRTAPQHHGGKEDNRIAHLDKISFLGLRSCGYREVIQFTWIYNRPINLDALHRFQQNLGYGLLGRRIERSPIPFARDRWVLARAPQEIDITSPQRSRTDVRAWMDELACFPIDPETGPSWHLSVLPLEGDCTAISLVASHTVVDAVGMSLAIADASEGRRRDLGYPLPGSRSRATALIEDGTSTIASVPEMVRALADTLQLFRHRRQTLPLPDVTAAPPRRTSDGEQPAPIIGVTAYIDLAQWDRRAENLGGTSNSLLAGVAARLGERLGRVAGDGTATLFCPVSERSEDDTRGNALTYAVVTVDPTCAARDLADVRSRIKQALVELATNPNESLALLPLASMIPNWLGRRLVGLWPGSGAAVIGCSNVGELDSAVNRPDGTDADYLSVRLVWDGTPKSTMGLMGGKLFLLSGRVNGKVSIAITACLASHGVSRDELAAAAVGTFEDFQLIPEIE